MISELRQVIDSRDVRIASLRNAQNEKEVRIIIVLKNIYCLDIFIYYYCQNILNHLWFAISEGISCN